MAKLWKTLLLDSDNIVFTGTFERVGTSAALPVITEVGGTSQVIVTMVPFRLGKRLESEMVGPGEG